MNSYSNLWDKCMWDTFHHALLQPENLVVAAKTVEGEYLLVWWSIEGHYIRRWQYAFNYTSVEDDKRDDLPGYTECPYVEITEEELHQPPQLFVL